MKTTAISAGYAETLRPYATATAGTADTQAACTTTYDTASYSECYVEPNGAVKVVISGGELAPEIAFGGATTAEESWSGEAWEFDPICDNVDGRKLIVFGITNDQTGYMLTDNSWRSFLCENEEIVTAGPAAGSAFTETFYSLLNEVR